MTSDLVPGWYIILYHDVSWEESPFVRDIGGTCPPDVFRDHVRACEGLGELVSIREGMEKLKRGDIAAPLFSFWFDDGFVGARKYAAPILAERGITGATSICSRFTNRSEMFWRCKLSYLQSIDAGRHLRARLRKYGYSRSELVREFTIDRFGGEVLSVINTLYDETTSRSVQEDAFRIFDTPDGLIELHKRGWVIANHSAAHYPISEKHVQDMLMDQFEECERFIQSLIGTESNYWVTPFAQNIEPSASSASQKHRDEKNIVLVADRVNVCTSFESTRTLYRIDASANDRNQLAQVLFAASKRLLRRSFCLAAIIAMTCYCVFAMRSQGHRLLIRGLSRGAVRKMYVGSSRMPYPLPRLQSPLYENSAVDGNSATTMVKVGIIGTGLIAKEHAKAISMIPGSVTLIAAADIVHERLQDFCSAFQVRWLPLPSSGACPDRAPPRSAGLPRRAGGARVKSALNFLSAAVYGIGHLYSSCLQPGIFHRFIPISERLTLQIV